MNGKTYKERLKEVIATQVAGKFHHLTFEQRAEMVARLLDAALAPTPAQCSAGRNTGSKQAEQGAGETSE